MQKVKIEIINKDGIHSRSANIIAESTNKHSLCDIKITKRIIEKLMQNLQLKLLY